MKQIITIYELLTMVHNDEAPRFIKYNGHIYTAGWGDYMGDEPISEYYRIKNRFGLGLFCQDNITLDTQVEIYTNLSKEQELLLDNSEKL